MINLDISTMIYRPIWQFYLSDLVKWGVGSIGTLFRSISHLMGRRVESTFEVTEYELNKKYGFKSLSGPLQSQTSYAFEIAEGSTKITVSTQANLVNALQMAEGILEKQLRKQLKENLAMLKDLLEAQRNLPASRTVSLTK